MTQKPEEAGVSKNTAAVIVVVAVLACSTIFPASSMAGNQFPPKAVKADPIVGTWECSGSPPPFIVIKNFNAGGTMMEIDNITTQESPTIGTWKRTGDLTYFLVARQITYDASGNFAGIFHYTQPLTMDSSHDTLEGTFDATLVDPDGNAIPQGSGEVSCKRMPFKSEP
jgi:hypothetical protein